MALFNSYVLAFAILVAFTGGQDTTYVPGALDIFELDMYLSAGMSVRMIAISGERVTYANGTQSTVVMHDLPDGAGEF